MALLTVALNAYKKFINVLLLKGWLQSENGYLEAKVKEREWLITSNFV